MAGGTNRAFKAAGLPKAAIKEIRLAGGRGLSLRSAISLAEKHGVAVPDKARQHLAKRDGEPAKPKAQPPAGWQAAAKGGNRPVVNVTAKAARPGLASALGAASKGMLASRKNVAAKEVARAVYERGNATSAAKLADMRLDVRMQIRDVREAKAGLDTARQFAAATTERALGKVGARRTKKSEQKIADAVNGDPRVHSAARKLKAVQASLSRALASRNATAQGRKQQRGAESGGQMDLFSGAPKPRAPSPFERRMALRDARAAQLGKTTAALSRIVREKRAAAGKTQRTPLSDRLREIGKMKRDAAEARAAYVAEVRKENPTSGGGLERYTPRMSALAKASNTKRAEYEKASKLRTFDDMQKRYWGTLSVVRNAQKAASRASSLADAARSAGDRTKAAQLQEKANALYKRADDARTRAKKFDTVGMSYERAARIRKPGK